MKEWLYQNIEHIYNSVKYLGIINGVKIAYHFIYINIFCKNKGKSIYSFLNLKFAYISSSSLIELFSDIFTNNPYYFRSRIKSPIIIDIGANIGDTLIYFKYLYPESYVFAYEPQPNAFKLLEQNVNLNKFEKVSVVQTALGMKMGTMSLYSDNSTNYRSSSNDRKFIQKVGALLPYKSKLDTVIKVPVIPFSSEYMRLKLKKIDLVKIDAEGAEADIIVDLDKHGILKHINRIILEYHFTTSIRKNSFDKISTILTRNHFTFDCFNVYRLTSNVSNNPTFLLSSENTEFN